jgi:putative ABC transport system permease protein
MQKDVLDVLATVKVGALTDKLPLGVMEQTDTANFTAIVPRSYYDALTAAYPKVEPQADMHIVSSDPLRLQTDIEEVKNASQLRNMFIYNLYQSRQRDIQMVQLTSVFVFGFVILISAICVANIFNTISTSISLRKREFAMLRSVGMTPAGFGKMIRYESIFYGVKALLYGLPLSFATMFALYRSLSGSFSFAFTVPWLQVGIAVLAVFLIVGLAMLYSGSKVRKENIMDSLKQENI